MRHSRVPKTFGSHQKVPPAVEKINLSCLCPRLPPHSASQTRKLNAVLSRRPTGAPVLATVPAEARTTSFSPSAIPICITRCTVVVVHSGLRDLPAPCFAIELGPDLSAMKADK